MLKPKPVHDKDDAGIEQHRKSSIGIAVQPANALAGAEGTHPEVLSMESNVITHLIASQPMSAFVDRIGTE